MKKQLGKYEILEKIGEGGFGVVYKGRDPLLNRLVAVKTCTSDTEKIRKRFFREAEIAGRLHHPNVVTVHDFGVEDGTPYLVQEFLPGRDLDHVIEEEPDTPLGTRVRYLRGIAEGLRYAHSEGVIHRDVKPANVRVIGHQRVKVMDFGIAKIKGQHSQLTDTGLPVGTVSYLSPEQLTDSDIDHRCDIFAYGVTAFEVLAGRRPFRATSVHALFYQLLNQKAPTLTEVAPQVPESLGALVARCLEKDREKRYSSFEDVIDELEVIQQQIPGAWDRTEQVILLSRLHSRAQEIERLGERAKQALTAGDPQAGNPPAAEAPQEPSGEDRSRDVPADDLPLEVAAEGRTLETDLDAAETAHGDVEISAQIEAVISAHEDEKTVSDEEETIHHGDTTALNDDVTLHGDVEVTAEVEAALARRRDKQEDSDVVPAELAPLANEVMEHLDSGEIELAALAFVELEQKARGGSFLEAMRDRIDAGFKN